MLFKKSCAKGNWKRNINHVGRGIIFTGTLTLKFWSHVFVWHVAHRPLHTNHRYVAAFLPLYSYHNLPILHPFQFKHQRHVYVTLGLLISQAYSTKLQCLKQILTLHEIGIDKKTKLKYSYSCNQKEEFSSILQFFSFRIQNINKINFFSKEARDQHGTLTSQNNRS